MNEPAFSLRHESQDGLHVLRLEGRLGLQEGVVLWQQLRDAVAALPASGEQRQCTIELAGVQRMEGAAAALLVGLQDDCRRKGIRVAFAGASEDVSSLLALYGAGTEIARAQPRPGFVTRVGLATLALVSSLRSVPEFAGSLVISFGRAIRSPRSIQWSDVPGLMERAGADGLFIVGLVNFLVGLILGLQGALQLERFGAESFLPSLVGISVVRELGPLMTAILVAGRTGAAYAAELGTMKVSEEVDALRTLGLDPNRFLVLPRVITLFFMVPLLTVLGDVLGIFGGMAIGMSYYDMSFQAYLLGTQEGIALKDVHTGVGKSFFFGALIAIVACQRGLTTRGGAAGVGRSTTSAVVSVLFALVAFDFFFTWVFSMVGW